MNMHVQQQGVSEKVKLCFFSEKVGLPKLNNYQIQVNLIELLNAKPSYV